MITPVLKAPGRSRILRALRIPDAPGSLAADPFVPEQEMYARLEEQITGCVQKVLDAAVPRAVYRILSVEEIRPLLEGNDIRRLLEGCGEAVLMALTLGSQLEKVLMREEVTNMSDAYVLDVCASEAVEEAADDFELRLRKMLKAEGKYLTNRYSPGYGDLPIHTQRPLLDLLNAGRAIGLTLTPTDLMIPRKSITAIMGICDSPKPDVYGGCGHCPILEKCAWRSHGQRCYA